MNIIRFIGLFAVISIFFYTHWIIPTYPTISSDYSIKDIHQYIEKVMKNEARNYSFEALSNGSKPVSSKLIDSVEKFDADMINCNTDKECSIETYENFMNEWVSSKTKAQTRYLYMDNLGFIGKQINNALDWSY